MTEQTYSELDQSIIIIAPDLVTEKEDASLNQLWMSEKACVSPATIDGSVLQEVADSHDKIRKGACFEICETNEDEPASCEDV